MTAKEYLNQIMMLSDAISHLESKIECLRETAGGSAAIRYDKLNVQISAQPDIMERNVLRLMDLEDKLLVMKLKHETLKHDVTCLIERLENENDKTVLKMHYVYGYSFNRISAELGKDIRWMKRVHSRALESFEMLYLLDTPPLNDVK